MEEYNLIIIMEALKMLATKELTIEEVACVSVMLECYLVESLDTTVDDDLRIAA